MKPEGRTWWIIRVGILVVSLYVVAAMVTFAFRHPGLTDTERVLRILDALRWL